MYHYQPVAGGDTLLVDLGDYGLIVLLDGKGRWYDVAYVKIEYGPKGDPIPHPIPADMIVKTGRSETVRPQADIVRIWRHGPESPSRRG